MKGIKLYNEKYEKNKVVRSLYPQYGSGLRKYKSWLQVESA